MFRVLITVALIQHNLGKPLEDGLLIPHDVEMIPVEEHGHHITTASLERISIEDNEIPLSDDYEGEIDDNDNNIPRPDRDTASCSAEVDDTDIDADCKDDSFKTDLRQEKTEQLDRTKHENVKTSKGQETNESVEATEGKETNDSVKTNEGQDTNERAEITEGKETDDGVESNEGKETNESVDTNESVETNEVVLLNQTIRMNSSAFVDGKLTIVLNFEVLDDNTVKVVSSEIVDPSDVSKNNKDTDDDDDDDDIVHFSGPVHAHGKVCVAAHYGCVDDHTDEIDSSEIVHPGDVSKDSNETVDDDDDDIVHFSGPIHAQGKVCVAAHYGYADNHSVGKDSSEIVHPGDVSNDNNETVDDEDDGDEDDDGGEDDDNIHFCGPVHAQGNVCVGAHYGCGGPPISMCFSRPWAHGQHFSHTSSENDHDFQNDEDLDSSHFRYRCPNIACQYYPSVGSFGPCRIPEYHFDHHQDQFDHHQDQFDHHHDHHFDHDQDYHFDHHHDHFDRHHNHHYGPQQDQHFEHHQDHHFDHSQNPLFDDHHYEDFEEYFNRVLGNSDYDSGEEDDFPRWFPVSGYVPASGSVKIAARY